MSSWRDATRRSISTPLPCGPDMIVFTDLDGTLIDFETYSAEITAPRVRQLLQDGTPVVFCSSKTRHEQRALMQKMKIDTIGIVENGSGIYLPENCPLFPNQHDQAMPEGGRMIRLGKSADEIQQKIDFVSAGLDIDLKPYANLNDREISKLTGLSGEAASRARQRDFSETLTTQLDLPQWTELQAAFADHGLQCLCGGRFYTVSSANCHKGKALQQIVQAYSALRTAPVRSIAIGDSANDVDMLKAADVSYLVQQPSGAWHEIDLPGVHRMPAIGPVGWLEAINHAEALPA